MQCRKHFLQSCNPSFLPVFYLSPLTFFVYPLISLSPTLSFFACLLLSFLAVFHFLCLSSTIISLLFLIPFLQSGSPFFWSFEAISPAQIYCANLNSSVFFLLSFVVMHFLNEAFIFLYFILSVAYFILFLLLSSTFPLSIFPSVYLVFYYYFIISIFFLSFFYFQFLAFSAYFSIFFFIVCFSFILFPILFNYLVLIILELNCCNFSLFSFSINLYYLFSFSLAVFFTKCELVSFFTFQHMLCSVFWFFT